MKKIPLFVLILIVTSCHSQDKDKPTKNTANNSVKNNIEILINPKAMQTYTSEKFDIENFMKNKNKEEGSYSYTRNDGTKVLEAEYENEFSQSSTPKYSLFTIQKEYFKNGSLKIKWETFGERGFIKGIRYEYDEKGKLIKAEDYDKPFKFTWEQVKKYIEQDLKLDFFKDEVNINNYNGLSGGKPTWDINFKGNYKDVFGVYYVTLDGTDGELLKVKKYWVVMESNK
ncbi:hypothetical protein [Chryseobacterium sp.]|uniref:hypothetical protein n=1 Tax=Chryseobacterium sp. TaxID=1871047 RepID=UPI002FCB5D05